MNLCDLFDLSLVNRRDEVALEWQGEEYTFGEIDRRSNRMAAALVQERLAQGDRVCVQLANCLAMIELYLACVKLGVIFVPVNILYRDREVAHIVGDAKPKLFITENNVPEPDRRAWRLSDPRWRHARRARLHLWHYGNIERRDPHPQQFRRECA